MYAIFCFIYSCNFPIHLDIAIGSNVISHRMIMKISLVITSKMIVLHYYVIGVVLLFVIM